MRTVTNRAQGPRFFWEKDAAAPTVLYPGESRDLDLVTTDDKVTKAWLDAGEIEFGKPSEPEKAPAKSGDPAPAQLEKLTDAELRTYITDRGGKFDGRWARDRLLDEARAVPAKG